MSTKQLELLNAIARIATTDLELRPMLQRITDALAHHFDWQLVALVTTDPNVPNFVCQAVTSSIPTDIRVGYSRAVGSGVIGEVAATRKPLVIDDVRQHGNYVDTARGVLSEICVPVEHKGELVAILNIESTRLGAFHDQLPLLVTVADQIAGAIASARLYDQLKERAGLLEMMTDVSRTALEATTLDDFLDRVVRYVHGRFPVEIVSIRLYDSQSSEYVRAADAGLAAERPGDRWPTAEGVIGRSIRTGEVQLVLDVGADPDFVRVHPSVAVELAIPIRHGEDILGVLNLETSSKAGFSPSNITAFEGVANQIAGALRLFRGNEELASAKAGLVAANEMLTGMVDKFHAWSAQDSLTGLYNRSHFDRVFPVEWRRASRSKVPLSVLIADIDEFKAYNDAHGHPAGDDCLKRVAQAIRATVHRAGDVVARFGGEEFAILLPYTDGENARRIAETIRQRVVALAVDHPVTATPLTISVGVASAVPDGGDDTALALVEAADRALYAAKRGGRNRVELYTPDMEPQGRRYSAPGIDVYFDARTCIHSEECVRGLSIVFNTKAKPWIIPGAATPDEIAPVIERCPSGALHYVRRDGGVSERPEHDQISLVPKGPLYVRGVVSVRTEPGAVIRDDVRMALCRCGQSRNKPFCDNSHRRVEFDA